MQSFISILHFINLYATIQTNGDIRVTVPKTNIEKSSRIATLSAGIEGINQAVRALYSYKDSATYKDLAKGAGLHPVYMSQSLSASRDVGLTELAGKRGLYKLTEIGNKYALNLSYGENDKAKAILRESLLKQPNWAEIIKFLKMSYKQERNALSLVADIESKLGKHWTDSLRNTYANAYTTVLKAAGLIETSGNSIISQVGEKNEEIAPIEPPIEESRGNASASLRLEEEINMPLNEDYSEFSIPEAFKVFVCKNVESLNFFESQVKENSIFIPWIQHEKRKIETTRKNC